MYRVIPPEGLALPDVFKTEIEAYEFFRSHYFGEATEHNFKWYWLEQVRPLKYGDFIPSSALSGLMIERMAELGVSDIYMVDVTTNPEQPMELGPVFEDLARHIINEYTEELGLDIPGWFVEGRVRVDSPD